MRIDWNRLIGSPPDCYGQTQKWAKAAHHCDGAFEGLIWNSRQYDGAPCLMLFGDRVDLGAFEVFEDAIPLSDPRYLDSVEAECEAAGITLSLA